MHHPVCPTCSERMEQGFIPDLGRNAIFEAMWYPGEPREQEDTILGINMAPDGAVEIDLKEARPITAFRCDKCGRLDLFAP